MNAINRVSLFPKKRAKQGTAGFSLIELLVVIGIIAVLSAVAIPAYRGNQKSAAQASISSSLRTIGKSIQQCMAVKSFAECDDLAGIEVSCPDCSTPKTNGTNPPVCVDITKTAAGTPFKGCVSSEGGLPTITRDWSSPCNTVTVTYGCGGGPPTVYSAPTKTCAQLNCTTGGAATPGVTVGNACSAAHSHSCATNNAADKTNAGAHNGTCQANGTCN